MQEIIKNRVRELLDNGYDNVIGWEVAEGAFDRTPAIFDKDSLNNLVYDSFCGANVAKYLVNQSQNGKKTVALIKPCDSYSLNQLCTEHRVNRENIYAIGAPCCGKLDVEKIKKQGIKGILEIIDGEETVTVKTLYGDKEVKRADVLLDKCLCCKGKEHKNVDETIGQSRDTNVGDKFEKVAELEKMTPEERFEFWRGELSKCIRCNACRNVCPACSCIKCVFDNPATEISNKAAADDFEENMFHIIRAYHVAGRCTDCGECSRVCPEGILLHLLNRKLIKDINELYGDYQAGDEIGQRHPLTDFTFDDAEASVVTNRGGDR